MRTRFSATCQSWLVAAGDNEFLWPDGVDPSTWEIVRTSGFDEERVLEHVALEEIANAMRIVAEESAGASEGELRREALSMFGGRRITDAIGTRLDAAMQVGLASHRVQQGPESVWTALRSANPTPT